MTRHTFIDELEKTSDRIADISRADLQILLRRAALVLRNVEGLSLDADADQAIDRLAAELDLPRLELLRIFVRDGLINGGWLPADTMDEETETGGSA